EGNELLAGLVDRLGKVDTAPNPGARKSALQAAATAIDKILPALDALRKGTKDMDTTALAKQIMVREADEIKQQLTQCAEAAAALAELAKALAAPDAAVDALLGLHGKITEPADFTLDPNLLLSLQNAGSQDARSAAAALLQTELRRLN